VACVRTAQSLFAAQTNVSVRQNATPTAGADFRREDEEDKIKTVKPRTEPEHCKNYSTAAIFTQHQLDLALYGYAKCSSPQNQATTARGPALSGLRTTGLSYGNLLKLHSACQE